MKRFYLGAVAVGLLAVAACVLAPSRTVKAEDFDNPKAGAVKWKVVDYNRITTHPSRIPFKLAVGADGGIGFDFLYTPDTALLGTSHPSYKGDLFGDMTNETLSATVGVTVTPGTQFTYYGQPDACGNPAYLRFYFETDTSGKFEYTDYWWSNPVHANLDDLKNLGDQTLVVDMSDPAMWSDWNGQFGTTDPVAFAAAVKNVKFVGLSFGGGCFFENGVGIAAGSGSGSFRLMDFTATP